MHPRAPARLLSLFRHFSRSASVSSGNSGSGSHTHTTVNPRLSRVMSFSKDEPEAGPTQEPTKPPPEFNFPLSEIPKNPLGEGRFIRTAAALIIGYVSHGVQERTRLGSSLVFVKRNVYLGTCCYAWTWRERAYWKCLRTEMKSLTGRPSTGTRITSLGTASNMELNCEYFYCAVLLCSC